MISESAATPFSLTICESTWVVCDDESMCQLWNPFRWWFLSRQRCSFPRLFLSQRGLCVLTNPCVISGSIFGDDFWVGTNSVFLYSFWVNQCMGPEVSMCQLWKMFWWGVLSRQGLSFPLLFLSQQGLWALSNPCASSGSSFGDDFWVGSDSVFIDYFRVNRRCVHWRIHTSALEAVSVMISWLTATQVSFTLF